MKSLRPFGVAFLAVCYWASPGQCEWQRFTRTEGLAGLGVNTIFQDRAGSLWFGMNDPTGGGLSRYDGVQWTTYTTVHGLAANDVRAILEDRAGNLWFGTAGSGVSRYDGTNWRTFTSADGLVGDDVSSIAEDRAGNLWVGAVGPFVRGVSRYDGTSWRTFGTAEGLAGDQVNAILVDHAGNLWFGTERGVSRYDGTSWRTFTTADGLASDWVAAILEDRSGNLWFGTQARYSTGGVSRYDGASWRTFTAADGLASDNVMAALQDRDGNLWFGTYGGVSRYDGTTWRTFTTADGLTANEVTSILEDRSGNLWFGVGNGAIRYDRAGWKTFTTADGLPGNFVKAILRDRGGNLWYGTESGLSRYDGTNWTTFLEGVSVSAILEDHIGNLWVGTSSLGEAAVLRYDGVNWTTFTAADGLAGGSVTSIVEDRNGNLWFGIFDSCYEKGVPHGGVSRYDGTSWRTFTTADGLAGNNVWAVLEDRAGNLWFGTSPACQDGSQSGGATRYDGTSWRTFTTADGLAANDVRSILQDRSGTLWFGTISGVSRYDAASWRTFGTADGFAGGFVAAILEDRAGDLWFALGTSVSRFDGTNWGSYSPADGLAATGAQSIWEDRSGEIWFSSTRHDPDRVPPRTLTLSAPPSLSAGRVASAVFVAAHGESRGIRFSLRFDGGAWSPWSASGTWLQTNVPDGLHLLEARTRDLIGNVDPRPDSVFFEIDATPPAPVVSSPAFGQIVRGLVGLRGTAADARFREYRVEVRRAGTAAWSPLAADSVPVTNGKIAEWDTRPIPDGDYQLRLSVTDTFGLTGTTTVDVVVQQNAAVTVTAAGGGDVYTTDARMHLYFPPHAFSQDAVVRVVPLPDSLVPSDLGAGVIRVFSGDSLGWGGVNLDRPGLLELFFEGLNVPPQAVLALYGSARGADWRRIGGTVEQASKRISAPIAGPGRYALFAEQVNAPGTGTLSSVSLTPRVFSPQGTYSNHEVAIGFTLGRSGPVTVKVFNRAGRLIGVVANGEPMGQGANLVRWDGRSRDGALVTGGLYLVSVEALGEKKTTTLGVVR